MPANFPANPAVNDTYSYAGATWTWTGSYWQQTGLATYADQNVVPVSTDAFDLGSANLRWRQLYLSDSGIDIDGALITSSNNAIILPAGSKIGTSTIGTGAANKLYVSKNGNDSNSGSGTEPFLTIKAALLVATSGTSIEIAPGTYTENNPLTIPAGVAVIGDNLRSVTVIPQNPAQDLFYMSNATYVWGITIKDYLANGFAYNPATPSQNVYVSPYIQNVTSTTTTGTAVKIDGNLTSAASTKAMIVGFFTIINRGGKGIHITNNGYSQLVNIYTIACDVGVLAESGGFCTLNGSDCSVGNYGLKASGIGILAGTGTTYGVSVNGIFQIRNLTQTPKVNQTLQIDGDPSFYSIDTISQVDGITWQIDIQEFFSNTVPDNTTVNFYQRSAIIASAHTFEYVGAGTTLPNALPQYGGIPIEANEVVEESGGRVTFTSTDHKGNFKIGVDLKINQATGSISGDSFNRSLFSLMTPYIIALQ